MSFRSILLLSIAFWAGLASAGFSQGVGTVGPTLSARLLSVGQFGFDEGGTAALSIKANLVIDGETGPIIDSGAGNGTFYLAATTPFYYYPMLAMVIAGRGDEACDMLRDGPFDYVWLHTNFSSGVNLTSSAPKDSNYNFFVLACAPGTYQIEWTANFVNPGGDTLGSGVRPFLPVFVTFLIVFILVSIAWIAHLIYSREYLCQLHVALTAWPLAQVVVNAVGVATMGTGSQPTALFWVSSIFGVVDWILLFLIACGYCIVTPGLRKEGIIYVVVTTVIFFVFSILVMAVPHPATIAFYVIVIIVIIGIVFRRIVVTRRDILAAIESASSPQDDGISMAGLGAGVWNAPLKARYDAMTYFLGMLIAFIICEFIITIVSIAAVLLGYYWVPTLVGLIINFLMFGSIAIIFRLRHDSAYLGLGVPEKGNVAL